MNKICKSGTAVQSQWVNKIFLTMRLTIILLFSSMVAVSANTYSQTTKFSMLLNNVSLKQVFQEIEETSEFIIVYSDDIVDVNQKVNVSVNNATVEQVLRQALMGTDLTYKISERQIAIAKKNVSAELPQQNNKVVSGIVTDASGLPLPGVTVVLKGSAKGTVTNIDGEFSLEVPQKGSVLTFSFVGFQTQEIEVGEQSLYTITMIEDIQQLDEIIAIGYGVQKKSDLTGATHRLTEEDMNKSVSTSPIEMMQGRVSGVNITQNSGEPGSGMSVRIRGSNSIRSGQEPLYVIDGVPLDNSDLTPDGATQSGFDQSSDKNPMSFLNPDDIESIDILKDASSTAIYGARGANGVVIITTKKGKEGKGLLTYDAYFGVSQIRDKIDVLSANDFRAYRTEDGDALTDYGGSTDWQDAIFRNALTQSHNVSFSGGTSKGKYRASLGYIDQEGIIESTGMERINGKATVSQKLFEDKLSLVGNLIVSHSEDERVPIGETGGYEGDVILNALKLNPTHPIYNDDGSYYQIASSTSQRNPLAMCYLNDDITNTDRIVGNISGEFEIVKGLNYKLNIGFDRAVAERRVNQSNELNYMPNNGEADINSITASNRLIENYITYDKTFEEDHHFTFLLGHAYQFFKTYGSNLNVDGFTVEDVLYTDNLEYGNYSSATVSSFDEENELQSFFGRINYNFKEKYLLTLTARADGSSKFGENNKYGFFPSAAFAWRASEEEFVRNFNVFDNLKIRLGWGLTGNQEIPNKISQISVGTTGSANAYFDGTQITGITFLRTPNPDIQWETTEQIDLGIDFAVLNSRLFGAVDLFRKTTKDVLLEITSKTPAPTETTWTNVDDLKILNTGVELELNAALIRTNDLLWEAGCNFSYIRNKVKDLPVTLIETGSASGQGLSDTRVQIITNDRPIGTFYGRVFEGFDEDGYSVYKTDEDGDEVMEYIGSALPDYTYSFNTSITYKNFDFSMLWYGSHGNDVYNNTRNALFTKSSLSNGYNVTYDVANSDEAEDNSNTFSSRFVEDASFLRLSNVTLGYTFDTKNVKWVQKARVYITGNNLLLFTDYSGWDPEVNTDASYDGIPSIGIDYTSYPKARTFTLGVNLQF